MAILYQEEQANLIGAYVEARALMEAMAALLPDSLRENLPRLEATVRFKYRDDGEIEYVFCAVEKSDGD